VGRTSAQPSTDSADSAVYKYTHKKRLTQDVKDNEQYGGIHAGAQSAMTFI